MISPQDANPLAPPHRRVLAAVLRAVKVWAEGWAGAQAGRRWERAKGRLFFLFDLDVLPGDLLDEIDDTAAQFGILDAHERLGQREAI
jgi:hypothetical protein